MIDERDSSETGAMDDGDRRLDPGRPTRRARR
jgi:hypothetical protein